MKRLWDKLFRKLQTPAKGQSLVELAIIFPIVMFMLVGVFEVGWALRGYFVMVNANREATRFAIRPKYLDFSIKDPTTVGYDTVATHAVSSIASQLPIDFTDKGSIIITHLVADTGFACDPDPHPSDPPCDCDAFIDPAQNFGQTQVYTYDDLVRHPAYPGFEYYAQAYPTHTITATLVDYTKEISELVHQNNKFNCELQQKGGNLSANNLIITEFFYEQPQLFGFPLISNPYTDPVPLYTHTTMRLIKAARGGGTDSDPEIVGPVCEAYPIVVHKDTIQYGLDEDDPGNKINQEVDIFDGNGSGDVGWLSWHPGEQNEPYLEDELRTSRTPLNDYTNARDSSDHNLSVGDWVATLQGVNAGVNGPQAGLVDALVGKKIRIPVWDDFDASGNPDAYHIIGFAWVRIEDDDDITLPAKVIKATYLGPAADACTDP